MNLELIQRYCKDKRIILVGNSSSILTSNQGKFIDSHDIVVRMNYAFPVNRKLIPHIGSKTDIYLVGISRARIVETLIHNRHELKFILRLNPHGEVFDSKKAYFGTKDDYRELKKKFGDFKPSTGCLGLNFFKQHVDYKLLNLIGFDFFENANSYSKNIFKSYRYRDHDVQREKKFIINSLDERTKIIKR